MEARRTYVQNPRLRRRALLRLGAAAGVAVILAAAVMLLLRTGPSVADLDRSATIAAPAVAATPASSPALEYPGEQGHYPDAPEEQPSTF